MISRSRSNNGGDDIDVGESFCFEDLPPTDSSAAAAATRHMMAMSLLRRRRPPPKTKSLSMTFIRCLSGLGCEKCRTDPFIHTVDDKGSEESENKSSDKSSNNKSNGDVDAADHTFDSVNGDCYNLKALQKSLSTISPLVSAPMMLSPPSLDDISTETILGEYMCFCRFYKVSYNAGVLTTLRFSLPCLRTTGPFHDEDMLALVEMLLRHGNGALKYISRLDFSIASKEGRHWRNTKVVGFTSHGALALAKALQTTQHVRQVFLPRHRVGPYGAAALFLACHNNPIIEVLNMRRCRVGERGAFAFCEIILGSNPNKNGDTIANNEKSGHGLVDVDLSANYIGHIGTSAIERALEKHLDDKQKESIYVNLEGNLVFPEVRHNWSGIMRRIFTSSLIEFVLLSWKRL